MEQPEILSFWAKVQELFELICTNTDKLWQKRKRILNTKLLVVFILKIILSKNKARLKIKVQHLSTRVIC